jgi:hypothetical protein
MHVARWSAYIFVSAYYRTFYRVRGWGRLPRKRGPSLLVANHQHEMESAVIVGMQAMASRMWRTPMYTVSSRRMWEPGFFAERIPWLRPFFRDVNLGWLFAGIGMQPIENELHSRPFVSVAYMLTGLHGDLPIDLVFKERARDRLNGITTLAGILSPQHFDVARTSVSLSDLLDPYRAEMLAETRNQLEADIAHFQNLVRGGATVFLTPEGFYTGDGKMQRFRGILNKLAPIATIYVAGISYDPFVGRRFSMLFRVRAARTGIPLEADIKSARPVTTSALLGSWLYERGGEFDALSAQRAVEEQLAALPGGAFVDPELAEEPAAMTRKALQGMERLGIIRSLGRAFVTNDVRRHPQFPRTDDMLAYMANFHAETLEGLREAASA